MSLDQMAARTADLYTKCFGTRPRYIVAAPGRVNLMGEHTDYNAGFVLPMAIENYTLIAGSRVAQRRAEIHSMTTGETASFSLTGKMITGTPPWSNYIRGVVAGFQQVRPRIPGFDALIESSLPFGGGLASSAALEVATATLMECLLDTQLQPVEKALLCQKAEHDFAGVPCGIMDQFASVLGVRNQALLLDCRSNEAKPVRMHDQDVTVLIINTNVRHRLAESEYPVRRRQCEEAARTLGVPALRDASLEALDQAKSRLDPIAFRRARHVISENQRVLQTAQAIEQGDWDRVGQMMYDSHDSLRTDFEVSSPELDSVVEIARKLDRKLGVYGCRMTGAGFGGCAICLVDTANVRALTQKFEQHYEAITSIQAAIFASRPADGARVIR
jgi:galactokinase